MSQEMPQTAMAPAPTPQGAGGGTPGTILDPQTIAMLQQLQRGQSQPHQAVAPPPVKPMSMGKQIAMQAIGSMVPFVGGAIQSSIRQQRETQIADVMGKFEVINNEMEMAKYVSGGDPAKEKQYLDQSPQLKALFADKKFAKGMQKVFGTDLLNPEKQNTIYHEGMKRFMKLKPEAEKIKNLHDQMQQRQAQGAQQPSPQGQQQGQPSNTDQIAKLPKKTIFPDSSKVASLENALTHNQNAETSALMHTLSEMEKERSHRENEAIAKTREQEVKDENQRRDARANRSLAEKSKEFKQTDEYRRWKEKLDVSTKTQLSLDAREKAPASIQQTAIFARGALKQLESGKEALARLEARGVLGTVIKGHVEDFLFGKGLNDPRLTQQDKYDLGKIRTNFGTASSGALKAHTGRSSKEIYDDFKGMTGIGQDIDALHGSLEGIGDMLGDYANAATTKTQHELKKDYSGASSKVTKGGAIPD